ncbi:hypothetical protein TNCV_768071 [Trichonephila clavipes]|nr:hypothetical protein TNCV_768071 [Trichonephila clavipes]
MLVQVSSSSLERGSKLLVQSPVTLELLSRATFCGRSSRVVKVLDSGWPCHEFEPSTTKDPPFSRAMHAKSVGSSNVLPLAWCGS